MTLGVITTWDNEEHTIVRYTFEAKWTWDDLFGSWEIAVQMSEEVSYEIDAIVDMTASTSWLSYNPQAVKLLGEIVKPDKIGMIIIVKANVFIQTLWNMYTQLYPASAQQMNLRFMSTMDEAREAIANYRNGNASA